MLCATLILDKDGVNKTFSEMGYNVKFVQKTQTWNFSFTKQNNIAVVSERVAFEHHKFEVTNTFTPLYIHTQNHYSSNILLKVDFHPYIKTFNFSIPLNATSFLLPVSTFPVCAAIKWQGLGKKLGWFYQNVLRQNGGPDPCLLLFRAETNRLAKYVIEKASYPSYASNYFWKMVHFCLTFNKHCNYSKFISRHKAQKLCQARNMT